MHSLHFSCKQRVAISRTADVEKILCICISQTRIYSSHFAGESTDALQTSGLSAFTASKSYNFILVAALLLSAAASGTVA